MVKYSLENITWLGIEATNICNMTCDYCPKSLGELDHRFIGIDILQKNNFIKIIDFLPELRNLEYVTLTNFNEFFQTPHLTTFYLPELKKRGVPYLIATNGSIAPNNIDYYSTHQPKYLVVGVQTITEQQYYRNNRLKGMTWEKYVENVANLISFFHENCHDTFISVDIATNSTDNWISKLTKSVANKNIPSLKKQINDAPNFISKITELTGIDFTYSVEESDKRRYLDQNIAAKSVSGNIVFSFKNFLDISDFYNNIPLSSNPICHSDSLTFGSNGAVKMCCIDFRGSTSFANVSNNEDMSVIFNKYLKLLEVMRTKGSPFKDCRKCMGYKSKYEMIFNIKKRSYNYLKKIPIAVKIYAIFFSKIRGKKV